MKATCGPACRPPGPPARSRRTARGCLALSLAAALSWGGCVAPAFDSGAFTHNAIEALDSAQSESTTAALALRARLDDKLPQPYVDNVVTDSEQAIGPIQDSFGSVDPPIRADNQLRDAVSRLLGDTADALAAARIAVRQHDESGMRQSATDLEKLAQQLEQKSQALS